MITCWFGEWKSWINLHLESCARNPSVEWLFLHDQNDLPDHRPVNVRFLRTSLTDIEQRFEARYSRKVRVQNPYKMCDLKPLLGELFSDVVGLRNWWGMCDTDLIWGDIRRFISDEDLAIYDVITSHVCTIVGQFTLFKTPQLAASLFWDVTDVGALLDDPNYQGIDELLIDKAASERESAKTLRVSRRMLQAWERLYQPGWEQWASDRESARLGAPVKVTFLTGPCEWREGRVFHTAGQSELMFFHFLEWKRRWRLPVYPWPLPRLSRIAITENGFGLTFEHKNKLRNLRLKLFHVIPFRIFFPMRHQIARGKRGLKKIKRFFTNRIR